MDMADERIIIGILVNNHFGVLTRVSELFAKRCYNIDSLVVGETDDSAYSRMTIVARGDGSIKDQMVKQLAKLHDVHQVAVIPAENASVREHMLVKLHVTGQTNTQITTMFNRFGAKVVDFSADSVTAEVTGEVETNDHFVMAASDYGILEICRAGAQALHRGSSCLQDKGHRTDGHKDARTSGPSR